jgi:membrane protease YdiL (CAAX protease family)
MTSEPSPEAEPFPTIGQAVGLTLFASILQGMFMLLLISGFGARVGFLGVAAIPAFGLAFAVGAQRLDGPPATALGLVRAPPRAWLALPFLCAGLLLTSELHNIVLQFFPYPEEMAEPTRPEGFLALVEWGAVLVLVLPATEEFFFRGLLQPGLVRRVGAGRAVLLTAALYGLAAFLVRGPHVTLSIAAAGLLLGFVRHASGSLLPALGLNVAFGFVTLLATVEAFGIPGFDDTSAPHTPLGWLIPAALLVGFGLALCREGSGSAPGPGPAPPPGLPPSAP